MADYCCLCGKRLEWDEMAWEMQVYDGADFDSIQYCCNTCMHKYAWWKVLRIMTLQFQEA